MIAAFIFIISGGAIVWASSRLVHYSDDIAERTRLGQLWVGATMLAAVTSLPEVATDITATRIGAPNLAAGDLFGSSMANMFILAALSILFARQWRHHRFSVVEWITLAVALVVTAEAMAFIAIDVDIHLFRVGAGGILITITYVIGARTLFRRSATAAREAKHLEMAGGSVVTDDPLLAPVRSNYDGPSWRTFAIFFAWSVVVLAAAPFLANSAEELADLTGLGDTFFGVLGLAIVTSLPELASSIAAFRRGLPTMVLGNVLGSNGFNMLIVLPVDISYTKAPFLQDIQDAHALSASVAILMMLTAVGGVLLLARLRRGLGNAVLGATVLLYAASMYAIYVLTS